VLPPWLAISGPRGTPLCLRASLCTLGEMRIVSLLPSTTEILFALGAGEDVVGVTFECDYPEEARSRRIVSTSSLSGASSPSEIDAQVRAKLEAGEDLYHLDAGALADLDPDLIVSQDLCAVCAVDVRTVDAALEHLGCRAAVLTIDPMRLDEVLDSIRVIGEAVGRGGRATALVAQLRERLADVGSAVAGEPPGRVAIIEWTAPLFSSGHWVPDMVAAAGGVSALGRSGERSRPTTAEAIGAADPDVVVVAPCGYHLAGAEALAEALLAGDALPAGVPVWAVDADSAFVRPGPRLVDGVEALAAICHPGVLPARPELATFIGTRSANAKPSRSTTSPTFTSTG
jgi:iron complex transport system substrate-binding protein